MQTSDFAECNTIEDEFDVLERALRGKHYADPHELVDAQQEYVCHARSTMDCIIVLCLYTVCFFEFVHGDGNIITNESRNSHPTCFFMCVWAMVISATHLFNFLGKCSLAACGEKNEIGPEQ